MDAAIRWEASPRIAAYRKQLLGAGFQEAALWQSSPKLGLFYRPCTEQTAFVVDLLGTAHWVEVAYGFASTAFTRIKGNEDSLAKAGVSAAEIHLREKLLLASWEDEPSAREAIAALYRAYPSLEKEELFALVQEKRKAFLRQISQALRPLGFRKQGNAWTADLAPRTVLQWHAQKSGFSDEYYFSLFIRKQGAVYQGSCFYDRLHPAGLCPLDWQAMPPEVFQHFLDSTVVPVLEKILHTPLGELGKDPSLWRGCACQRDLCPACWVEKNLWQALEEAGA